MMIIANALSKGAIFKPNLVDLAREKEKKGKRR